MGKSSENQREEVTICEQQYGFMLRKSTTDALFALRLLMEKSREVVMDRLMDEVRQASPWTIMFVDDIVICGESRKQVEKILERWSEAPAEKPERALVLGDSILRHVKLAFRGTSSTGYVYTGSQGAGHSSTGAPQGCVLSLLLYSLYTYDCVASSNSTTIIKFADDTVVVGLISNNDETDYLQEVKNLKRWCQVNNLLLNVSKTKELIVDFSMKQEQPYQPLNINGTPVERVDSFRIMQDRRALQRVVHSAKSTIHTKLPDLQSCHINTIVKKARQHLYHLRRLRDFKLPSQVLKTFYTFTIESVLTGSITSWFWNSIMQDRRALQRVVHSAKSTIHTELPDLQDIYSTRCRTRARKIVKDLSHPNNGLFSLLCSGKRFRSLNANTERMRRSFFPQAIRSLN
ncbi:gastrula zinc finger protein XlCGF28.1-like [Silurus meridionalis]|nr:gastrula zinc finger protein XlCGF28.1-like [Silurus meridionalis]